MVNSRLFLAILVMFVFVAVTFVSAPAQENVISITRDDGTTYTVPIEVSVETEKTTMAVPQVSDPPDLSSKSQDEILEAFIVANEVFARGEIVPTKFADGLYSQPKAVVLQCTEAMPDSHTIFGQPLGSIAVVRNMANTLPLAGMQPDSLDTASIEAAVKQGARLIVVLGHKDCAIMKEAVLRWNQIKGKIAVPSGKQTPTGNMPTLYQVLYPAVTKANKDGESDILEASIANNVANTVASLKADSFFLSKFDKSGDVKIIGAVYDPETKKVEFLDK